MTKPIYYLQIIAVTILFSCNKKDNLSDPNPPGNTQNSSKCKLLSIKRSYPSGASTVSDFSYDEYNRVVAIGQLRYYSTYNYSCTYNADGRINHVEFDDGNRVLKFDFTYSNGQLVKAVHEGDLYRVAEANFSYDAQGRLSGLYDENGDLVYQYVHDNSDTYIDRILGANGSAYESFQYDEAGRLKTRLGYDQSAMNFTYDNKGNTLKVTFTENGDYAMASTFTYDSSPFLDSYLNFGNGIFDEKNVENGRRWFNYLKIAPMPTLAAEFPHGQELLELGTIPVNTFTSLHHQDADPNINWEMQDLNYDQYGNLKSFTYTNEYDKVIEYLITYSCE